MRNENEWMRNKLFIKRVGCHEQWGAIHSAEIGGGTLECRDIPHTLQMIKLFIEEKSLLADMCENIVKNKAQVFTMVRTRWWNWQWRAGLNKRKNVSYITYIIGSRTVRSKIVRRKTAEY